MQPVLISIGPLTVYSFGVFAFLGFLLGMFVVWKKGREQRFEEEALFDAILASCLMALVGARTLYILLHMESFGGQVLAWLNLIGRPGLSLLGGMVGGAIGLWWQARKRKWDFLEFTDLVVIAVSLAFVFGWFGAFLNGSGYGVPTDLPIGVRFPGLYDQRHPIQLYALFAHLFLFAFLWWAESRYRTFGWYTAGKSTVRSGFLTFSYLFFSGLMGVVFSLLSESSVVAFGIGWDGFVWTLAVFIGVMGVYLRSGRQPAWAAALGARITASLPQSGKKKKRFLRRN